MPKSTHIETPKTQCWHHQRNEPSPRKSSYTCVLPWVHTWSITLGHSSYNRTLEPKRQNCVARSRLIFVLSFNRTGWLQLVIVVRPTFLTLMLLRCMSRLLVLGLLNWRKSWVLFGRIWDREFCSSQVMRVVTHGWASCLMNEYATTFRAIPTTSIVRGALLLLFDNQSVM